MTVSIFVGAIAERDHPIRQTGEVRLLTLKTGKQRLRVVGNIALSVGGSANQERSATLKDAGVEPVHCLNCHLMASRLQCLLHFLRHHLGRASHGSDKDRDVEPHACVPHPEHYYTCGYGSI